MIRQALADSSRAGMRARQHHHRVSIRSGSGNRVTRQNTTATHHVLHNDGLPDTARQFLPDQATDHILATKLLRKIRDRHDNRPEDIIALRERILTGWSLLDKQREPRRSLALLQLELHRLGHDDV